VLNYCAFLYCSPAVATHNQWLVVAGGYDDGHNELVAVELLNTDSQQ